MLVIKVNDESYVAVVNDVNCVADYFKAAQLRILIKLDNGSVLTNSTVMVNGAAYATDSNGYIAVIGNSGDDFTADITYGDYYGNVSSAFGEETLITLTSKVTLTVRRYETSYQTLTTVADGNTYSNDVTIKLKKNVSVTVTSGGGWEFTGYIIVNGVNSRSTSKTFTISADTTVTTTEPYDSYDDGGGE